MKSYIFKILLLTFTLTLASCMPDSLTKFKEDPPKKTEVQESGGTVIIPEDLYLTNGVVCSNGNGKDTVETRAGTPLAFFTGTDLVVSAPITAPFNSATVTDFQNTPYSLDGTNDPNHEFILIGDNSDAITDLAGTAGVECHFADDAATTDFDGEDLGAKLTWSISPTLPTGLTLDTTTGGITGTLDGFNELTAYTITATNDDTGTAESDTIEIASSSPVTFKDADDNTQNATYYTQKNGTQWAMKVTSANDFTPNHWVVNENGAYALINFIDRTNNILYLTIQTPASEDFAKFFKNDDQIDQVTPVGTPVFSTGLTGIEDLYATLLTTDDLASYATGTDATALHYQEDSGFVQTDLEGGYDGLTRVAGNNELSHWVRCTHSPDISTLGTIDFLDGVNSATKDPLTDKTDIINWGEDGTNVTFDDDVTANLDKICEFSGAFGTAFPYTKITTTLHTYAGESVQATIGLQAKATIRQPYPITNPYTDANDNAFYFHYRYTDGTTGPTDQAKLIIEVTDASSFSYDDPDPANNTISNDRGTKGVITYITDNFLYVTLDNNALHPNAAYAFVANDAVDDSSTFLSPATEVVSVQYTFEIGKVASATTVFTPRLPMNKAEDRLNIDATGLILTPYGTTEFSTNMLEQIKVGGRISMLGDSDLVEDRTIASVDLTPGAHSITMTVAYTDGIPSDVNKLSYISALDQAANELGSVTYGIDSFVGIVPAAPSCTGCAVGDLVLVEDPNDSTAPLVTFSPTTGEIQIANNLNRSLDDQEFTITATDLEGNIAQTKFKLSIAAPPAGLSLSRNLLLAVPSGSAFQIGSYISSNNADAGLGIVKDILPDKTTTSDVIDIQLIKGTFAPDDDIDNRQAFDSQKTYVFSQGVIPYNITVYKGVSGATLDSDSFQDRYSCSNPSYRRFTDGTAWDTAGNTRGIVAYTWDTTRGVSVLVPTTTERVYLQLERGTITDGSSVAPMDCTGTLAAAQTIDEIIADNLLITHAASGNYDTGLNITSNDGADRGSGVIHKEESTTQAYIGQYYFAANALFLVDGAGENLSPTNPYAATAINITATELDHTFYLYRFEEASVEFNLEVGNDSTTSLQFLEYDGGGYCSSCATLPCTSFASRSTCEADTGTWVPTEAASFPPGLDYSNTTGRISGEPQVNADKQKFVLRASNPYGTIDHVFELKVYDHFLVRPTDTALAPKPDTYVMHQVGYGMSNVPCRVTQEAMNTANPDVTDLTCVMDGGESDIFYKGLDLTVRMGDDMCTAVKHTPYYYYDWKYQPTSGVTLTTNSGAITDALCTSSAQPSLSTDVVAAGTYPAEGAGPAQATDSGYSSAAEQCESGNGGGNYSDLDPAGPSCDDGAVQMQTVVFTANPFSCLDAGTDSGATNFDECYENVGTCAPGGGSVPGDCSLCPTANDCSSCTSRSLCAAAESIPDWSFTGTHNQALAPANADCTADLGGVACTTARTGTETPVYGCEVDAPVANADVNCGGNQGACIGGAGAELTELTDQDRADRNTIAHIIASGNTELEISYKSPDEMGAGSNIFLANYMNRTACEAIADNYDFDWDNWIAYAAQSPTNVLVDHPFAGGYNYYSYSCDSGAGTVARVRMHVREFDTSFDVTDGIEEILISAYGVDNVMDDPGDSCGVFLPCNGINDLDDYYNANPGGCGAVDLTFDFGAGARYPQEFE